MNRPRRGPGRTQRPPTWPRAVLGLLVAAGSAAVGLSALAPVPAGADTPLCANVLPGVLGSCPPPVGTVSAAPSNTGGPAAIKTAWTGIPADGHIDAVTVTVDWTTTGTPNGAPTPDQPSFTFTAPCSAPAPGGAEQCDVAWPSQVASKGYVLNGHYKVSASAATCPNDKANVLLACTPTMAAAPSAAFAVANPPAPPANVTATLAKAPSTGVIVAWNASPEPDVFAYGVFRVSGGVQTAVYGCSQTFAPAEYLALARCGTTLNWADTKSGGGNFTYQVVATRFGASYARSDVVTGSPGQTKAVTVAGVVTPTVPGAGKTNGFFGLGGLFTPKPRSSSVIAPLLPRLVPTAPPSTADAGFNPTLPYGQQPAPTDPPTIAASVPPAKDHSNSVGSIALVGAGLLVIVVALHGLWLRGEVKRSGPLEALEPDL